MIPLSLVPIPTVSPPTLVRPHFFGLLAGVWARRRGDGGSNKQDAGSSFFLIDDPQIGCKQNLKSARTFTGLYRFCLCRPVTATQSPEPLAPTPRSSPLATPHGILFVCVHSESRPLPYVRFGIRHPLFYAKSIPSQSWVLLLFPSSYLSQAQF